MTKPKPEIVYANILGRTMRCEVVKNKPLKPIGRPPIDGARATSVFSWRVTASRKLAYQTAAGSVPVVRWAFKLLDRASGYKQDKKGKL